MSDLLGLLHLGSAGLSAQHSGASVAANNRQRQRRGL
jgi:hypothetical protein